MKPFNLEAAKAGAPLVTRSGAPVQFVAHLPEADELFRVVVKRHGENTVYQVAENGAMFNEEANPSDVLMETATVYRVQLVKRFENLAEADAAIEFVREYVRVDLVVVKVEE